MTTTHKPDPPTTVPLDGRVGRLVPERSNRHLLTPDMLEAEDAAGGVFAAGGLVRGCSECAWGKVAGCWRCGSR